MHTAAPPQPLPDAEELLKGPMATAQLAGLPAAGACWVPDLKTIDELGQ